MHDTRETMAEPNPNDELPLQLPPSDGQADDDGVTDSDFGEHEVTSEDDERVGLDVSVGFDQEPDMADLLDDADGEHQRWTEGTETAQDSISLDHRDLEEGAEDGWTDGNEAAGDQVAHHDDDPSDEDLPPLGPDPDGTAADDGFGGADQDEGADEADLPPLDAGEAEGDGTGPDDLFDSALLRPLDLGSIAEPDRIALAPSVWATRMSAPQVRSDVLGHVVRGARVTHVGSTPWLLTNGSVVIYDTDDNGASDLPLKVSHWVADPNGLGGVLSHDKGLSWYDSSGNASDLGGPSADPTMFGHAVAAYTQDGQQPKLWAQTRLGALFARVEEPVRWSLVDSPRPGRHLTSDGRRSIGYVHAPADRPCVLMRSTDAGLNWTQRRIAVADESLVQRLLVCRDAALVVSDSMTAPIQVYVGDAEPVAPVEGLGGPLSLNYEDSEVVLYGFLRANDRTLLVRQAFGWTRRAPVVVHELDPQVTVSSMSVRHDGTQTELLVVADDQLLRVTIAIEPD